MRILLTNDDGLRAPGIEALYSALVDASGEFGGMLRHGGEGGSNGAGAKGAKGRAPDNVVVPIAPLTVQSATSHGVTFKEPLMTVEERLGWGGNPEMTGIAVDGRPADCVKLALTALWTERFGRGPASTVVPVSPAEPVPPVRPDLVISGMNMGANVGINVIYSGTVAAALEAAFLGVPAIAVSLHIGKGKPRYDVAARYARRALDVILAEGLPRAHECLSINIPITEREWDVDGQWPPIRVCPMNTHGMNDKYERRVNPAGDVYYWAAGSGLDFRKTVEGSDVELLWKGCITVTPLLYDLTRRDGMEEWKGRLEGRRSAAVR